MKRFILFARLYTSLILASPATVCAQEVLTYPNYVVIGAFAHHKNAVAFTSDAGKNKFPARFEMNPNRNLYYVYVLTTDDRELAIAEAVRLRAETKYFDTWVYSGALGDLVLAIPGAQQDHDLNPLTGERLESVNSEENGTPSGTKQTSRYLHDQESEDRTQRGSANNVSSTRGQPANSDVRTDKTKSPGGTQKGATAAEAQRGKNASGVIEEGDQGDGSKLTAVTPSRSNDISGESKDQPKGGAQQQPSQRGRQNKFPVAGNNLEAGTEETSVKKNESSPPNNTNKPNATSPANNSSRELTNGEPQGDTRSQAASDTGVSKDASLIVGPPPIRATTEPLQAEDVVAKNFYFHLFRADNGKMIAGEVDAIDFERARRMGTYPGNNPVTVRMPSGKTKQVSFLCQVFGYRKQQKEFDPNSPAEDLYLDDRGNLVVPFELVRLQKGDIAIMYNVFFFKDAAVMRPESRYEVNNLLELLTENPSYNIIIHGHTNGNANGKIIRMDTPGNFYSLTGTKHGYGSARKLSEERAIVIRDFLINSGIGADRMKVKAWGGKKPIHDKHSVRAHENVRVEIEILSR